MHKDEVITILRRHEGELRQRGVKRAALFGSLARGEASSGSDVDIFVELDPAASLGVWEYAGICERIGELVPGKVDVSNRATLKTYIRTSAERDAIFAF